jgi:ABC-type amino acid transport substrate-binding protein
MGMEGQNVGIMDQLMKYLGMNVVGNQGSPQGMLDPAAVQQMMQQQQMQQQQMPPQMPEPAYKTGAYGVGPQNPYGGKMPQGTDYSKPVNRNIPQVIR